MPKDFSNNITDPVSKRKWKRTGLNRRAGVLVPLFSVYSKNSAGIADFSNLKLLVDWCKACGFSILQLLPMNETGATSCPYDAISSFALEPSYINLNRLPIKKNKALDSAVKDMKDRFPAGPGAVNYAVKAEKQNILKQVFSEGLVSSAEFRKFEKVNSYWLEDYALYKVLKGDQGGRPWYDWDDAYRQRDSRPVDAFAKNHKKDINFHKWIQMVAFEQFAGAKTYASSKHVMVCGDLPILTSRDSADVWAHQEFFKLELASGAPPDMYCAKGQRWGMPTYNWDKIESESYLYIKEKLKTAENFYDMLRIDHVVGLFRIWSIPYDEPLENKGLNGFFDPDEENLWEGHGRKILTILNNSTSMLLCAEDLGMIPKVCPATLEKFAIQGNDVQRWTKDWKEKHDFLDGAQYRLLGIAMLSTHDTMNWAGWWENEAGTVDEDLFARRCGERGIDFEKVRKELFDPARSRHGRLRWLEGVNSIETLVRTLGKKKEELADFIEMYENTFLEKEKLWKKMSFKGPISEASRPDIIESALKVTLGSASVFCIELFVDYLGLSGLYKGDPYKHRINTPGTISGDNWSLTMPVSLEELIRHKANKKIKDMVASSGRR